MGFNIVWFRNDLRVTDNPALWHGSQDGPVVGVFFITPEQWRSHQMAGCRVDFILRTLRKLRSDLDHLGIPLVVQEVRDFSGVPEALSAMCRDHRVRGVYWNNEYPLDEWRRDRSVEQRLATEGVRLCRFHDRTICPPGTVVKEDGGPYQVFTPFKRRWRANLEAGVPDLLPAPKKQQRINLKVGRIPADLEGFRSHIARSLWPAGERAALARLDDFVGEGLDQYREQRDFPAHAGTSALSPYLAVGAVSPQQCLVRALSLQGDEGAETWIDELTWRDFYQHIVFFFPDVCKHRAFKPETESVQWRCSDEDFNAWSRGETGIPLVDAGMRQLQVCGWMHNRVRMVVAMFLAKNLLLDWRRGEAWFMEHLIDGDFPANNGGWQWSASTGTDAAPYFRIFNPFSQAGRFDPDAVYIKRFVPELGALSATQINSQTQLEKYRPENYPALLVDPRHSRQRALDAFKAVGG